MQGTECRVHAQGAGHPVQGTGALPPYTPVAEYTYTYRALAQYRVHIDNATPYYTLRPTKLRPAPPYNAGSYSTLQCCALLHSTTLRPAPPYNPASYSTLQCCALLHPSTLHPTPPYNAAPCCALQRCALLHPTMLSPTPPYNCVLLHPATLRHTAP